MKKATFILVCVPLLLSMACSGGAKKEAEHETSLFEDSVWMESVDSLWSDEEAFPLNADKLFEDFLFLYAMEEDIQKERTLFPLTCSMPEGDSVVQEHEWRFHELFSGIDFYMMLFDSEEQMEVETDTAINQVTLNYIDVLAEKVKNYHFLRNNGQWKLVGIQETKMKQDEDAGFFRFFSRFACDSLFQSQCVEDPLTLITIDPEDEFSIIEATIDKEQWFAFAPAMPKGLLVNLSFGQKKPKLSQQKVMMLKEVGGSICNILHFSRQGETWKLTKYEDTSN